jgi:hypothetical protein
MTRYNTNLAAEFYVLSMLHRLGAAASLTLGNRKSVDIFIAQPDGSMLTLDVKGLVGPYDWPANNIRLPASPSHFVALLTFENKIADPLHAPKVWVLPANKLSPFMKQYKNRRVVSRSLISKKGTEYLNNWAPFIPDDSHGDSTYR